MSKYSKPLKIAVDFDGTIVENKYPGIGREMLFAFDTMKALQEKRHMLILWTYRHGTSLDEAVEFCRENGVEFYAINNSFPEEQFTGEASRKIDADIFIDDRNLGGFVGWSQVWQTLYPDHGEYDYQYVNRDAHFNKNKGQSGLIGKLKSLFK